MRPLIHFHNLLITNAVVTALYRAGAQLTKQGAEVSP